MSNQGSKCQIKGPAQKSTCRVKGSNQGLKWLWWWHMHSLRRAADRALVLESHKSLRIHAALMHRGVRGHLVWDTKDLCVLSDALSRTY